MKTLLTSVLFSVAVYFNANAQEQNVKTKNEYDKVIVEAACGQCMFGMKSKSGCDLAIRMDGASYFVDGVSDKDIGDPHAKNGICNAIRKAEISGKVSNDRFKATGFRFLPEEK